MVLRYHVLRTPHADFAATNNAAWIVEALKAESVTHQFLVDAYCVMPDHLHFLALGMTVTSNLLTLAKSFKQKTAYTYQKEHGLRLWQKNFIAITSCDPMKKIDLRSGGIYG